MSFARAGALYTGVELSRESLKLAQQRFEVFGLSGNFFEGNAEDLGAFLPPQKFDLIYSFGVIHHSPFPEKIIKSLLAYAHPETELRIMLYAKNSWKNFMIDAGLDQPEAQSGCPIALTYDESGVRELLTGFDVKTITQDHIFPYIIDKYVKYEYEMQPWFASMPRGMFRALERKLGWHLLITATPSKAGS